jgi:ABC-type transport system substrate-binding protein
VVLRRRSTFGFWMAPLLATGPFVAAKATPNNDSLTIAFPVDIPHWDPEGQTGGPPMSILNSVFDTPITQTPDMRLAPRAGTEWRWAPDKMSLDVRLRDDIYFHNGDKMTTQDLKYTWGCPRKRLFLGWDTTRNWSPAIDPALAVKRAA